MEVAVAQRSQRETCMADVWERCRRAWELGEFAEAKIILEMYEALEAMSDEEFDASLTCTCKDCPCIH